jgi:DNA-binding transcriptional ArsR family regulator
MAAEHSLLLETLREIVTMLSEKSVASLIKSKDLDATVVDFCNLVKAYGTSQGIDAFEESSSETFEQTLNQISQHLATFSEHNLIELNKLDFVADIKPRP